VRQSTRRPAQSLACQGYYRANSRRYGCLGERDIDLREGDLTPLALRRSHIAPKPSNWRCGCSSHRFLVLFSCLFCHNPTLQHYRLPAVTTNVTKMVFSQSELNIPGFICQWNKRCMLMFLKPGADFSRGCAGKRIAHLLLATHPHAAIRELTRASLGTTTQHFKGW
jgi:hypothetical protein